MAHTLTFNGIYKDNDIMVDAVPINPYDYDLQDNYLWFDVAVSSNATNLTQSQFIFYLVDKDKKILNSISKTKTDSTNTNNAFSMYIGFDFQSQFFYEAHCFAFYYDTYKTIQTFDLAF